MDKEKNNDNWSEISKNASDLSKKIKGKFKEENTLEDLKDSFMETIENTSSLFKTLTNTIDSTITDEQIRKESKEIINKINKEIQENLKDITGSFLSKDENSKEEE
tara:strand:+ start:408 stop:725 length:318 start_codon:yes stop_codon:yes gene_type:complete